jgi:hypothetical protein
MPPGSQAAMPQRSRAELQAGAETGLRRQVRRVVLVQGLQLIRIAILKEEKKGKNVNFFSNSTPPLFSYSHHHLFMCASSNFLLWNDNANKIAPWRAPRSISNECAPSHCRKRKSQYPYCPFHIATLHFNDSLNKKCPKQHGLQRNFLFNLSAQYKCDSIKHLICTVHHRWDDITIKAWS